MLSPHAPAHFMVSLLASSTAWAIRSNARYLSSSFAHFRATSRPTSRSVSTQLRRVARRRSPTSSIVLFPSNSQVEDNFPEGLKIADPVQKCCAEMMSVLVMSRIRHAVIVPQPLGAGQERAAKISRKIVAGQQYLSGWWKRQRNCPLSGIRSSA